MQDDMVLRQDGLEVFGEALCFFDVAVGDVGDEVDDVVEGLDGLARRGRGRDDEDLLLGLILLPLLEEVVPVGSALGLAPRAMGGRGGDVHLGSRRILFCRFALGCVSERPSVVNWRPYKSASIFSSAPTLRFPILTAVGCLVPRFVTERHGGDSKNLGSSRNSLIVILSYLIAIVAPVVFWKLANRCQVQIPINLVEMPGPLDHVVAGYEGDVSVSYRRFLIISKSAYTATMRCQLTFPKQHGSALSAVLPYLLSALHCHHALSADPSRAAFSVLSSYRHHRLYLMAAGAAICHRGSALWKVLIAVRLSMPVT